MKENNDIDNDPRDRNKAASNLKFKTVAKGHQLRQIDDKPGLNSNTAEIKHNCPEGQKFDDKKGKCDFEAKNEGMKNEPTHPNDSDIHINMINKQNIMTDKQRDVNQRLTMNQAVDSDPGIPRAEFHNFVAKSKNKATTV